MSIGKQVFDCISKMDASDAEGALFAICAAIEATAAKEFNMPGRKSYKQFLKQNLGLITDIALGGRKILNAQFKYDHPMIKKTDDGLCTFEDIMYHAVRCGLYHGASLPGDLVFTERQQFKVEKGVVTLPSSLIYGLIVAVVTSPVNAKESLPKDATSILNLFNFPLPVNKLWGRRSELLWVMEALREACRIQRSAAGESGKKKGEEASDTGG